jgi:2'-5' RNA ligase superfamily
MDEGMLLPGAQGLLKADVCVDQRVRRRHARRVGRTALIVAVEEAEGAVSELRLRYDPSAPLGVPAHVTVLFPFQDDAQVEDEELARLFGGFDAFDFTLDRIERFDEGTVWLHPEPSQPFADLTAAVWRRWPEHPPYEGTFDQVIPHLTLSATPIEVAITLPIAARAREVTLIEEGVDDHWSVRRTFALG